MSTDFDPLQLAHGKVHTRIKSCPVSEHSDIIDSNRVPNVRLPVALYCQVYFDLETVLGWGGDEPDRARQEG